MVVKYYDCTKEGKPEECKSPSLATLWKKAIDEEWLVMHRKNNNERNGQQAWIAFICKDQTPPLELLKRGFIFITGLDRAGTSLFKVVKEELARRKEVVKDLNVKSPSTVTIVTNGEEQQIMDTQKFLRQCLQQGQILLQNQKVWCPVLFGWEDLSQHLDEKILCKSFDEDKGLLLDLLRRRFQVAASSKLESSSSSSLVEPPSTSTTPFDESQQTPTTDETLVTETTAPLVPSMTSGDSEPSPTASADEPMETKMSTIIAATKDEDVASFHKGQAWTTHDYVRDLHRITVERDKVLNERFDKFEQKQDQRFDKLEQKLDKLEQRFDKLERTLSMLSEYVGKGLLVRYFNQELPSYRFIHPLRSVKIKYNASKPLEDLAMKCLKYEGKTECGKDIWRSRDVPCEVEVDIKMDIMEGESGSKHSNKCILVEVSRSPQLYTHNFQYPNKASYDSSTKLLYKLIQIERGILAVESGSMKVIAAALINFPSFEYRSDSELNTLLKSVMESPAKNILSKLRGLYDQGQLYLLPF